MKLLIVILIVLAFWPILLGHSLSGRPVLAPAHVFSTQTYCTGDALSKGGARLAVLPTLRITDHNNKAGQSADSSPVSSYALPTIPADCIMFCVLSAPKGWVDSAISIWTGLQVAPDCGLASISLPSVNLTHHLQAPWSRICHWMGVGWVWLVQVMVNVTVYLFFVFSVGIMLLQKPSVERRVALPHAPQKPAFVSTIAPVEGSTKLEVHKHIFTLQGRLVLYPGPGTLDDRVEWTVLFHPRQYYRHTGYSAESSTRAALRDMADRYLLDILLRGVWAHHPWTWYLPGITVHVPGEIVKDLSSVRKPTSAESIICGGGALKPDVHGHIVKRHVIAARAARKPTFASSIERFGGPPKPAVQGRVVPMRPANPLPWIEIFTAEGRLLMYSGFACVGRPIEWRVRFDPCSTSRITRCGDKSTNCQRDMADGYLLNFLVHGSSVYYPRGLDIPIIVFAMPGEIVHESSYATLSDDLLDVTANDPPPSNAQDVPAITDSVESVNGPVTTSAENNVDTQTPGPVTIGLDATSQAAPLSPTLTAPANLHSGGLYHIPHSLPDQQREAARQDLRSGLPLWTQRARQRHAPPTGGNAWTHASQGGIAGEGHIEEESQLKEAPKRIKRRGGKKNELWKRKCRERRDHHEHNPGAGPSGLH